MTVSQVTANVWTSSPDDSKNQVKQQLLECLIAESDSSVRKKIGDTICEVAQVEHDRKVEWPELLGTPNVVHLMILR